VDPKAEEFYGWSGYNSNLDNPILNKDPEGDCPNCIAGAIIAALADYGVQVVGNIHKTGLNREAFTEISWSSVILSGAFGGASGGMSTVIQLSGYSGGKAVVYNLTANVSLSTVESLYKQILGAQEKGREISIDLEKTLTDVLYSTLLGESGEKLKEGLSKIKQYIADILMESSSNFGQMIMDELRDAKAKSKEYNAKYEMIKAEQQRLDAEEEAQGNKIGQRLKPAGFGTHLSEQ
jgi:hypothetical protein